MAIYHFSAKVIGRSAGRSAIASAAYRAGERLHDDKLDRDHDYTAKAGVVYSRGPAPRRCAGEVDGSWDAVECGGGGRAAKNAQLARDIEVSLPRELGKAEAIKLARAFVREEFVDARHGGRPERALDDGEGRRAAAARARHADDARGGAGAGRASGGRAFREEGSAIGTTGRCWWAGARRGRRWRMRGWPSWGMRSGSITGPMPSRASTRTAAQDRAGRGAARRPRAGRGACSRAPGHCPAQW